MDRVFVVLGRGVVILLGGVAAILSMNVKSEHLVLGGAVAVLLYLLVLWKQTPGPRRVSRKIMLTYWVLGALLLPWAVLRQHFGPFSLSALLFHLEAGLGEKIPDGTIAPLVAATGLMLVSAHALYMASSRLRWGAGILVLASAGFVLANPLVQYLGIQSYFKLAGMTPAVMAEIHQPDLDLTGKHPNLVMIYLEGLERTYGEAPFGTAYAPLAELAQGGVNFTGVAQLPMTGWTTAGVVASQCGYPLVPRGLTQENRIAAEGGIYVGQICLGDVLAQAGYQNVQMMGVEAAFGGLEAYFTAHHSTALYDLDELKAAGAHDESGWGLQDGDVFTAALDELRRLEHKKSPYALTVLTIGPHGPNGYVSKACRTEGVSGEEHDIMLAVACTAQLARDFVRAAQTIVDPDNTLFVLVSDHLAHPRVSAYPELISFDRHDTAIFLGAGLPAKEISRPGYMIDIYPTILDVMGFAPNKAWAGLGASLLSDLPEFGAGQSHWLLRQRLRNDQAFAGWLWGGNATATALAPTFGASPDAQVAGDQASVRAALRE